jgi:acyl-CoA reductase-like NAD-dependent aldehyde dehydrogenase
MVAKSCAATLKRMTLELGGNDACIVLPGVDLQQVALQVFISSMQNSGQFCAAAKRIYVHNDIYDDFATAYTNICKATKVGDGSDEANGMGPVNNRMQFNKVNEFLADIQANKQKVLTGGEIHKGKGFFIPLTVVDNPPENSKIVQEEPFGPIVPLLRFQTDEEVIKRANDTRMGLGGQVWGPIDRAQNIADQLETGTVWVNQMQSFLPMTYFGGW